MGNSIDTSYKTNSSPTGSKSSTVADAAQEILGKDDFLKLLVTELSNQDPLSPMDNKDMITQMAQFSTVEQMNNMSSAMEQLGSGFTSLFQHSLLSQGASMIGKYVAGMNTEGEAIVEGIVESVQWLDGNPQLVIQLADGKYSAIEMNEIISVSDAPAAPDPETDLEPGAQDPGTVPGQEDDESGETDYEMKV